MVFNKLSIHSNIKREHTIDTHSNTDDSPKHYAKWKKADTRLYMIWFYKYEILQKANFRNRKEINGC